MKPMALRRHFPRLALLAIALLLASWPAWAQPASTAGHSWRWVLAGWLLAFLLGGALAYVASAGARRDARRLAHEASQQAAEYRRQSEQLLIVLHERDELTAKMEEQERVFARLAYEDALTGLPNGRAFDEQLALSFARSKRHGQPLSLLIIDIDHLKQINESWSHAMGDNVLMEVAKLLRSVCRLSDLPARLGGDTFAVVLTDTDKDGGWRLSDRLHSAFARHGQWHSGDVGPNYVTFSAGLVTLGAEDDAPAQLFQRCDRALYLARNAGGARTGLG